jgi:hypothetical protein
MPFQPAFPPQFLELFMTRRFLVGAWLLFGWLTLNAHAQAPASVLVYNLYSSSPTAPWQEDTRLVLTNTSETEAVSVHLFFVSNSCQVADQFATLSANQTLSVLASDADPGIRGYVIAVAVNTQTGCPIKFNYLIGEAAIKLNTGHQALLAAEGIAALSENPADCSETANLAELKFDGARYGLLPRVLAIDHCRSRFDGNQATLIVNRIGGDLRKEAAQTGVLVGLFFDDAEGAYSFSLGGNCQAVWLNFPSVPFPQQPFFDRVLQSGRGCWAKLYSGARDLALMGTFLNFNLNARTDSRLFTGGHNLHHLTSTTAATLTIPVTPPNG